MTEHDDNGAIDLGRLRDDNERLRRELLSMRFDILARHGDERTLTVGVDREGALEHALADGVAGLDFDGDLAGAESARQDRIEALFAAQRDNGVPAFEGIDRRIA